jgi:hypothetical protein
MEKFEKLSKREMREVLGGKIAPTCPENACGGTAGTCPTGKTCSSAKCPDDPTLEYNLCS